MTTQPSTGPRPRTEAGDSLFIDLSDLDRTGAAPTSTYLGSTGVLRAILAIEAEARAAALTAVEEAVRGLPQDHRLVPGLVSRDRVIAVLAKLQEDEQ